VAGGQINITLFHDKQRVVFGHDGKPFSTTDLAALLSGGSSKEFDSNETTGRFGTGFLLTHVLSCEIGVQGILDLGGTNERFSIELDRSGNEEDIFENTTKCSEAIEYAELLADIDDQETARFTYKLDCPEAAELGVEAFIATLPHLYATCPHLGSVKIESEGKSIVFHAPDALAERTVGGVRFLEREVKIVQDGSETRTIRAMLVRKDLNSLSGLVVVLERIGEKWAVIEIPKDFPRIFVRFPIRTSGFLPINVIIDGRFDLFQERDSVIMEDSDRTQIAEALDLLPELVRVSLEEDWEGGFTLARAGMPVQQFGDPLSELDKAWWRATLKSVAEKLALMPIVRMDDGTFHKIQNEGPVADFITRRLNSSDASDDEALDFEEVWQAASELNRALPPDLSIAPRWTAMTEEWVELGVASERLALATIGDLARGSTGKLEALDTKAPTLEWLARFLGLVGKLVANHNCSKILKDFIPNQNGILKSPSELYRDDKVDERLKDIADSIGLGVRDRLLSNELVCLEDNPSFPNLRTLLESEVTRSLTSEVVLEECLRELSKRMLDTKEVTPEDLNCRSASVDLLWHMWKTQGQGASELARQCPLVSSDGTSIRWTNQRRVMAPVMHWHENAKPFSKVYKADRILAEDYMTKAEDEFGLVDALCSWGIAYSDPLFEETSKELRDAKLKSLVEGESSEDVVVKDVKTSRIAFLNSELIQRCCVDAVVAKSLLGLVVCYAAQQDQLWEQKITVMGRRNEEDVPVVIRPAMWIAELKSRAWVPVHGEHGLSPVFADAGNLLPLLEAAWLENNNSGIRLLCQFFGFKDLDLQLLAKAPTDALRIEMENGLARIVQTLGSDATKYGELASALEAEKRRNLEKERNRRFGLAVQDAIKRCLEANRLDLVLIDCGYDYDVYLDGVEPIDAGTHSLKIADYLLEVKATTTGDVRLTPAQARTASEQKSRFILCVVDLRGITKERMAGDWNVEDVEPRTKVFCGIGELAQDPSDYVEEAKRCPVGIRNDNALRYGVPPEIWEEGFSISEWMMRLPAGQ
jgi:hypothetical protein